MYSKQMPTPVPDSRRENKHSDAEVKIWTATEEERIKYGIGEENMKLTEEKMHEWIDGGMTTKQIAEVADVTENYVRVYAHQHKMKLNRTTGYKAIPSTDEKIFGNSDKPAKEKPTERGTASNVAKKCSGKIEEMTITNENFGTEDFTVDCGIAINKKDFAKYGIPELPEYGKDPFEPEKLNEESKDCNVSRSDEKETKRLKKAANKALGEYAGTIVINQPDADKVRQYTMTPCEKCIYHKKEPIKCRYCREFSNLMTNKTARECEIEANDLKEQQEKFQVSRNISKWTPEFTAEPCIEFKDQHEANLYLKEWQKRLFLDDWIIKVKVVKPNDMPKDDESGHISFVHHLKAAVIDIAKSRDDKDDLVIKCCHEQTLVHELLHCKYNLIEPCEDNYSGMYLDLSQHQLLEEMAKSLIMAKYGVGFEWFRNFKEE